MLQFYTKYSCVYLLKKNIYFYSLLSLLLTDVSSCKLLCPNNPECPIRVGTVAGFQPSLGATHFPVSAGPVILK